MEQASLVSIGTSVLREIPLTSDKFSIGRYSHNSLALADMTISPTHCILEQKNGEWYIFDKSSNGTWVNEKLVDGRESQLLADGDMIWLSARYRFMYKKTSRQISNSTGEKALGGNVKGMDSDKNSIKADKDLNVTNSNESDDDYPVLINMYNNNCPIPHEQAETVVQPLPKCCSSSPEPSCSKDNFNAKTENNFKQAEEELKCSICREMFVKAVTLVCSHTFCKFCIAQWHKNETVCPICRTKITKQFPTLVVDNFVEKVLESASEEVKQHRRELIAEREAALAASISSIQSTSSAASTSSNNAMDMFLVSRKRSAEDDSDDVDSDESDDNIHSFAYRLLGSLYSRCKSCYNCGGFGHWASDCPN